MKKFINTLISINNIPSNPILLFKSGFETDVELLPLGTGACINSNDYMCIIGADEGFDWSECLSEFNPFFTAIHIIGLPEIVYEVSLKDKIGHNGTLSKTLYQYQEYGTALGNQQLPMTSILWDSLPDKLYNSFWIRYDDLVELTNSSGVGAVRMLWQYKSGNWTDGADDPKGFRTSIKVGGVNDGTGDLFWAIQGDEGLTPNEVYVADTFGEPDPSMGVNVDGWNFVEIFNDFKGDNTGQTVFKLNGVEVFNITGYPTIGATDTGMLGYTLWTFYNSGGSQWIDDVAIWNDDPNITFVSSTSVSVAPATDTINVAAISQLTATVQPLNASNKYVKWASSDEAVATVDDAGLVTGVGSGSATITGTTDDGDFTDTSTITVNAAYGNELFDLDTATLGTGAVQVDQTVVLTSVANALTFVTQAITIDVAKTYKFDFTISSRTEGGIYPQRPYNALAEHGAAQLDDDYSYEEVGDLGFGLMLRTSGVTSMVVSNISLKEVL